MQTIAFNDFMSGSFKKLKKKEKKKINVGKIVKRVGTSIAIPLIMAKPALAASSVETVPASAKEWMVEQTI